MGNLKGAFEAKDGLAVLGVFLKVCMLILSIPNLSMFIFFLNSISNEQNKLIGLKELNYVLIISHSHGHSSKSNGNQYENQAETGG